MARPTSILITGAAQRVGRAITLRLAQAGRSLVLHANRSIGPAESLAEQVRAMGATALVLQADLADPAAVSALMANAEAGLGRPVEGLVSNASTFEGDAAQDFTRESWDHHFDVNVRAPCELARDMAARLPPGVAGSVVNVIDMRVFKLNPMFFTYTLSKAALHTATTTLAQALAPRVRVNAVAPGPTLRNVRQSEADFQTQVDATLLGNGSPPEAIAEAVSWLMDAGHVTGQTLAVDGGQSLIWRTPDVDGIVE